MSSEVVGIRFGTHHWRHALLKYHNHKIICCKMYTLFVYGYVILMKLYGGSFDSQDIMKLDAQQRENYKICIFKVTSSSLFEFI